MGSFLSGVFAGSNPTLQNDQNNAGNVMNFGTSVGEGDISSASSFDQNLLDGNPAETAKLLAPQISNITGQAQQQKNTIAQFGNRSGGNNSQAQTIDDTTRGNIDNMVSQLTGGAASNIGSLGTSTLSQGLTANQLQEQESQQALKNEHDSIFGQGLSTAAGAAEGLALGF